MRLPILRSILLTAAAIPVAATAVQGATREDVPAFRSGTTFVVERTLVAPASGPLYLSMGDVSETLQQPIGSCRLHFSRGGIELAPGTRLRVASGRSDRSSHSDRGVSTLELRFRPGDGARSLVCDTVGNDGPTLGEVVLETRGVFHIESPDAEVWPVAQHTR